MAYTPTEWKDHITPNPGRYAATPNGDGTWTLTEDFGTPVQEGTPISAANMNKIEQGIIDAEQAAVAWAKSFGLGTTYTPLPDNDANAITETGNYSITSVSQNVPPTGGSGSSILALVYGGGNQVQIFVGRTGDIMYTRRQYNGDWHPWVEYWHTGNLPNPAQTTGAGFTGKTSVNANLDNEGNADPHYSNFSFHVQAGDAIIGVGQNNGNPTIQAMGSGTAYGLHLNPTAGKVYVGGHELTPARWNNGAYEAWTGSEWKAVGGVKSIRTGVVQIPSVGGSGTVDVPISAIENLDKAEVHLATIISHTEYETSHNTEISAHLTSSTNVRFTYTNNAVSFDIRWYVKENN